MVVAPVPRAQPRQPRAGRALRRHVAVEGGGWARGHVDPKAAARDGREGRTRALRRDRNVGH
eukprot:6559372-Prymnesium_polylepis.1